MTPFSITSEPLDHALAVFVRGDLDLATVPELRAVLAEVRAKGSLRCVVDLTGCTFMDSSGSRTIALESEAFEDAGSSLAIHCPLDNRQVRFLIELVGLPEVVTVTPPRASTDT